MKVLKRSVLDSRGRTHQLESTIERRNLGRSSPPESILDGDANGQGSQNSQGMPGVRMDERIIKDDRDVPRERDSSNALLLGKKRHSCVVTRRATWRNDVAFWCLGLINNTSYVAMMAFAKDILPSAVGIVFFANIFPTMLVKVSAPYWFHLVPYSWRVVVAAVLMIMSFLIVGFGEAPGVQLIGVACSAFQGGIGEASCLALAAFYDTPRALTAWSSGTGFAGIFGYAWVFVLHFVFKLSRQATLSAACILAGAWLLTFFFLLGDPVHVIGCPREVDSGDGEPLSDDHASDMYTPLASSTSLLSSSPAEVDHESMGVVCEEEINGSRGSTLLVLDGNPEPRAVTMSARERFHFTLSLWPYMVPLMTVFFAEYTMQTGTWSSIGFPITSSDARERFYEYANWNYQAGVFFSRSSGMLFRLTALELWILPVVQLLMVVFFVLVAIYRFWYDNTLLVLCFGVGLVGGLGYVNTFRVVSEVVPPELKELALASASVGDSFGVMASDIVGTFLQIYLYWRNGISD